MLYDKPLLQSWKELFGKDSLDRYKDWAQLATDQQNLTPEQISNDFNKQFAAEIAAMQSIQKRGNLSGMLNISLIRILMMVRLLLKLMVFQPNLMHFDEITGQVVTDTDNFSRQVAHQSDFIDYLSNNLDSQEIWLRLWRLNFAANRCLGL